MEKVGVIIAHKDYNQYLAGCIASAAYSDYQNINIYLGDDGSEIDPIENIKLLLGMYDLGNNVYQFNTKTIKYIRNEVSRGPSYTRNRLIEMAFADGCSIIQILDADDELTTIRISKGVEALQNDMVCGAYSDYLILDVESNTTTYESKHAYDRFALMNSCIIHSGCTLRRSALEVSGLYDESLLTCEDYDLWLRLSDNYLFYHIPEPLTIVRNHQKNSTHSYSQLVWEENIQKIRQKCAARYS